MPLQGRTLDFLRRTGQYIGQITKPELPRKPEDSRFPSRTVTRARKQESHKQQEFTAEVAGAKVVSLEYLDTKAPKSLSTSFSENLLRDRPRPTLPKTKPSSYPLKTFLLDPSDSQIFKNYIVNKYARPKALIPVPRSKEGAINPPLHSFEMQRFLERFEGKREPALPPRTRKGFNGWKLTRANVPQSVESRDVDTDMLDLTVPEELCIQYLPWKHTIDDFA